MEIVTLFDTDLSKEARDMIAKTLGVSVGEVRQLTGEDVNDEITEEILEYLDGLEDEWEEIKIPADGLWTYHEKHNVICVQDDAFLGYFVTGDGYVKLKRKVA